MTYKELKDFCNSLTEEQLLHPVYLAQVDAAAIKIENAIVTEEDCYFDHCDSLGTLEDIKKEYPHDWEDVIEDATLCPKGTVMLVDE